MGMAKKVRGTRTGFTTGACAAAAAKAATRILFSGDLLASVESTLPNRQRVVFALSTCKIEAQAVVCGIIKDGGDDPDCTHGAEILARVCRVEGQGIVLEGGEGVATVTKPGLGLEVGTPAINAVPRRNITEMVAEELAGAGVAGAKVTIFVPGGDKLAEKTLNARLGLLGGISILGTTGIVKPYSTAAYKASVIQAIEMAGATGHDELVLTTGGKSEAYAMQLLPQLSEAAFIQVGDFIGIALRRCALRSIRRVHIVGMIGKLSKMADGRMQTHAAASAVNMALLAQLARAVGAGEKLCQAISEANTARHVMELCMTADECGVFAAICDEVTRVTARHVQDRVMPWVWMVDFDGRLLARDGPRPLESG